MVSVTFNLDDVLLDALDQAATNERQSRSRFITEIIRAYFAPKEPSSFEAKLLEKDLEHKNGLIQHQETEISDLKELNGRLWSQWHDANERLTQYQLPPARRSFWDWVRRRT